MISRAIAPRGRIVLVGPPRGRARRAGSRVDPSWKWISLCRDCGCSALARSRRRSPQCRPSRAMRRAAGRLGRPPPGGGSGVSLGQGGRGARLHGGERRIRQDRPRSCLGVDTRRPYDASSILAICSRSMGFARWSVNPLVSASSAIRRVGVAGHRDDLDPGRTPGARGSASPPRSRPSPGARCR